MSKSSSGGIAGVMTQFSEQMEGGDARDARAASNDEYEHGALPTPPPASSIHEESGARNDALPGSSAQRPAAAHDAQAHASMCQSIECRGHIGRLPFGLSVNWRLDAAFAAFLIIALLLIVVVFGLVAFVRRVPILVWLR